MTTGPVLRQWEWVVGFVALLPTPAEGHINVNPGASDPLAFMVPTVSWEEISPAHAELLRVYEKLRPLKIAGHL